MQPLTIALLADGPAAAAPGGGRAAALHLAPDTMHAYKLGTGDLVLVAVCSAAAAPPATPERRGGPRTPLSASSPAAARSPAPPPTPPSAAQLAAARPLDLWTLCGEGSVFSAPNSLFATSSPAASSTAPSTAAAAAAADGTVMDGRHYVAAQVWPAAKLPKGLVTLSPALAAALGRPAPGSGLGVYRAPSDSQRGGVEVSSVGAACGKVWLRVCRDPKTSELLAVGDEGRTATGDGSTAAPTAAAAAAAAAAKGAAGAAAAAASPVTPQRPARDGGATAGTSAGGGSNGSGSGGAVVADEWRRRLLAGGLDWRDERVGRLVERLAAQQLEGRWVLPGNVVPLPVLGLSLVCIVEAATPTGSAAAATGTSAGAAPLLVGATTEVTVLQPGDPPADVGASTDGPNGAKGTSQAAPDALAAAVAAARAAAAAAVTGSGSEAAAAAAERAVLAGAAAAASAGGGYAGLGGVDGYRSSLRDLVYLPLRAPQLFARYRIRPPRGVLLHGPPGTGKSVLARAAAADAGATLLVVNGPDVMSEYLGESEAGLQGVFAAARALAPAVILLDEVDALAPARDGGAAAAHGASAHAAAAGGGGGDAQARVLTTLLTLMDGVGSDGAPGNSTTPRAAGVNNNNSSSSGSGSPEGTSDLGQSGDRVVVIGATNRRDALDAALRRPGRLERELEIGVPSPAARAEILQARLARVQHDLTSDQVQTLAAAAHGFVSADLAALVDEAALCALRRIVGAPCSSSGSGKGTAAQANPQQQQQNGAGGQQQQQQQQPRLCVQWGDFAAAQARVRPSALREVSVEVPRVTWSDVGGLDGVKQRLKETVEWPQRHPDALARLGATPPRGILLYGPPGCSKTLLARAVASEARLNFLSVKGGELFSKWVGGGERAVAALFARARAAAPAIIFFDELDGLAGARPMGGGDTGGTGGSGERVLAQLLTELDGLQPRLGVTVLAATNRPDLIDAALLRPGRFDRLLRVPPPDAAARAEIFSLALRRTPLGADASPASLAEATPGYTGADITAVCREAAMAALDEDIGAKEVAGRHFEAALRRVPPSAPAGAALDAVYEAFERAGRAEAL